MVEGDASDVSSSIMIAVVGVGTMGAMVDEFLVRRNAEAAIITSAPMDRMSILEFINIYNHKMRIVANCEKALGVDKSTPAPGCITMN